MATQRSSFGKLQRDRAKKAKQAAKRERRQERIDGEIEEPTADALDTEPEETLSAAQLLELIEAIHRDLDAGRLDQESFEEKKADLLSRLPID